MTPPLVKDPASKDKVGWEDGSVGKECASQSWNLTSIPRLHEKVEEENQLPSGLHTGATEDA